MNVTCTHAGSNHPPFHPIAYHAGHTQESLRIADLIGVLIMDVKNWWQVKRQQRIDRQAFEHLLDLDDHMLRDIGLTRSDVISVSHLPLSVSATTELELIARQNRGPR